MYSLQFGWLLPNLPALLEGALATLLLTFAASLLGGVIGIAGGFARSDGPFWLRWLFGAYVEMFRNTPMLAQALLVYLGLANIGIRLEPMTAGALALIINFGAYSAEIFRGGFELIKKSQREAADCLALSRAQSFFYVILPQAMRNVWVPLSGEIVLILLASSIVSQISAEELTAVGSQLQSLTFRSFEVYLTLAAGYLVIAAGLRLLLRRLGRSLFRTESARPRSRLRALALGS